MLLLTLIRMKAALITWIQLDMDASSTVNCHTRATSSWATSTSNTCHPTYISDARVGDKGRITYRPCKRCECCASSSVRLPLLIDVPANASQPQTTSNNQRHGGCSHVSASICEIYACPRTSKNVNRIPDTISPFLPDRATTAAHFRGGSMLSPGEGIGYLFR